MATVRSAGILLFRRSPALEVWIAHMGGPFWAKKDAGGWSIPKGEFTEAESALDAALREFAEEIGSPAPTVEYVNLGEFRQSSGKIVTAFAGESDFAPDTVTSNTFAMEWPPRSGVQREFPEIDDARWFAIEEARSKVVKGQVAILDALESALGRDTAR